MKLIKNSYLKTFFFLFMGLFSMELIFRIIEGINILSFSTIRVLVGNLLISFSLSFIFNLFNRLISFILTIVFLVICGIYTCVQMGFNNFIGMYMSLQTSSQLGAVVDYITDFLMSFKLIYLVSLIPILVLVVLGIIFYKKTVKVSYKKVRLVTFVGILFTFSIYFSSIITNPFQSKFEDVTYEELFLTVNNPAKSITEYGVLGFGIIDVRSYFFPIEIESEIDFQTQKEEIDEFSREIDDTKWLSIMESETNQSLKTIDKYLMSQSITPKNEYTGLLENKNVIVILMESVNDIMINPEYYPNFSKLLNEGWYFKNYFSPRNACATFNNEFSSMTGLYSIHNTCTGSKYKSNKYPYSIFNLFNNKGYTTFSAHNYTQAYYPRKTVHPNMGSKDYYGVERLGISYSREYRNWSNDDEFFDAMLKVIDSKKDDNNHFMTYLTTVSSHQPYTTSSIQGDRYLSLTKGTNYSSVLRRYMSKLKILDEGFGKLLSGLESRGILDDTVIVLFGDHYPYSISKSNLNSVLDYNTSVDNNSDRIPFVIYNPSLEHKVFEQYTTYINIVPTLANLFNLDYDPRYYMGTDLLSDEYESRVVFADGSWRNEIAYYDASKNNIKYYGEKTLEAEEVKRINSIITNKMNMSKSIVTTKYYERLNRLLNTEVETPTLN